MDLFRGEDGVFAMVAVDQRSSLRAMLARDSDPSSVSDAQLTAFKSSVATLVASEASGILLDREFGTPAARAADCPVILAADTLTASRPGGPIDTAELDHHVSKDLVDSLKVDALKMLVPWLPSTRSHAVDLTNAFLGLCETVGLPGVVEGVVRPVDVDAWSPRRRADALVAAAEDLAGLGAELYKTEVVYRTNDDASIAEEAARAITSVSPCPWVVLSSGVPRDLFADALAVACEGGAEGFLAGRAIWANAAIVDDPENELRTTSLDTLRTLTAVAKRSAHA